MDGWWWWPGPELRHYTFQKSPDSQWKGSWQRTEPAASQLCLHQPTSDTRVEMSRLFHIYSQHSLQTRSSSSFSVSSALMKLTAFITDANSKWWNRRALDTFKNRAYPLGLTGLTNIVFMDLFFLILSQYRLFMLPVILSDLNKSYKRATEFTASAAQHQRRLCAGAGKASKYKRRVAAGRRRELAPLWHLECLNIIRGWAESRLTLAISTQEHARKNHLYLFWVFISVMGRGTNVPGLYDPVSTWY